MLKLSTHKKIAFVSSYPPTRCGIASFTYHLAEIIEEASNWTYEPSVIAVSPGSTKQYPRPVEFVVGRDVESDYLDAADYINSSDADVVSLQHEFGLFGGQGGAYISQMLHRLKVPVVTTLHSILERPRPEYFRAIVDVCDCSEKVIVMNKRGIDMLTDLYGVPLRKIKLIPHGIPDIPFNQTKQYKSMLGFNGQKILMSFGLLGPDKGIDVMLRAMPKILKQCPNTLYLVIGQTHPGIISNHGYHCEEWLYSQVCKLRLERNVIFHSQFVKNRYLSSLLAATDIFVTPYLKKEQLTSGTLAMAVGAGKATVSTPYWAAEEMLDNGRGLLVPFGDSNTLGDAISNLLADESRMVRMQFKAYEYGRNMLWPKIGHRYCNLVQMLNSSTKKAAIETTDSTQTISARLPQSA